jgi:hypothetical protein
MLTADDGKLTSMTLSNFTDAIDSGGTADPAVIMQAATDAPVVQIGNEAGSTESPASPAVPAHTEAGTFPDAVPQASNTQLTVESAEDASTPVGSVSASATARKMSRPSVFQSFSLFRKPAKTIGDSMPTNEAAAAQEGSTQADVSHHVKS